MAKIQEEEKTQARQEYMKQYRRDHKEDHRDYCRKWRAANRDKVAEYNARYWAKRAAAAKDQTGTDSNGGAADV